jgi:hypothetical protein
MKKLLVPWAIRAATFIVFYFLIGTMVGRSVWNFIENKIDAEALRQAVDLIGPPLGLKKITSIDSRFDAIGHIADYMSLPWALLGGICGVLVVEVLIRRMRK